MANGVDDRVFKYLQSADPDKTFVADERILPEEIQTATDNDETNWENFSKRLGSLDYYQKRQLKDLWIEGGRPEIKIHQKDSENRAWINTDKSFERQDPVKAKSIRDTINIYEHQLVGDFMAEISHAKMYAQKSGESIPAWKKRRKALTKRYRQQREKFGEDIYGGWQYTEAEGGEREYRQYFPYMGVTDEFRIGKDIEGNEIVVDLDGNVYPEIEVPEEVHRYNEKGEVTGSSQTTGWVYSKQMDAPYDPELRMGFNEQRGEWMRPTVEFEAHSIIEDSLWEDYVNRFGKEWGQYGTEWQGADWRNDEKRNAIQKLMDEGLLQ